MMPLFSTLVVVALFLAGVLVAFRAAATARTPQGAVAWVVFLITTPYLAIPLWLVLGSHRYADYVVARRDSEEVAGGIRAYSTAYAPEAPDPAGGHAAIEAIAQLPVVRGNDYRLLVNGADTFAAIFAAIDAAEHYVLVQYYTLEDDELGRALHERLVQAARRGVTVRLIFDQIGSHGLSRAFRDSLRAAGVIVMDPSRSRGPSRRFRINFRNHRKIVVVDGQVGFTGGLNVGDLYMGRESFDPWRDTHLRLTGPVVSQLQLVFAEDWHFAMEETLYDRLDWRAEEDPANVDAVIVATGPGDTLETGALYFFALIAQARERLWIATPYFVPDLDVISALIHASLRGVEVRILVPEGIDHYMPWLAAFAYFDEMSAAGVEIWRYQPGFMHQKVILVDDRIAAIGSTNMDNRSFRLNFEAAAVLFDAGAARDVEAMLSEDFAHAERLTKRLAEQPLTRRLGAPVARLFAPLL